MSNSDHVRSLLKAVNNIFIKDQKQRIFTPLLSKTFECQKKVEENYKLFHIVYMADEK